MINIDLISAVEGGPRPRQSNVPINASFSEYGCKLSVTDYSKIGIERQNLDFNLV
jgi:hypothetical protein